MVFDIPALAQTALRLGVALLLGSAIGFERQWNQKMAGLRTNALVALGASGFVAFSGLVGQGDPTRVAAQVVMGIGFLGAGVILREGTDVHGLDTAATLWCSAMVGTMAGAGHAAPALLAAAMVIATNLVLRPLVRRVDARLPVATSGETHYTVEIVCRGAEKARMRSLLLHGRLGLGPDVTAATGRSAARCPSPEREFWTPFLDRSAILDSRCPEMVEKLNDSNGPNSGHRFLDSAGVQKCRSGPAVQAIAPAARSAAISRSP